MRPATSRIADGGSPSHYRRHRGPLHRGRGHIEEQRRRPETSRTEKPGRSGSAMPSPADLQEPKGSRMTAGDLLLLLRKHGSDVEVTSLACPAKAFGREVVFRNVDIHHNDPERIMRNTNPGNLASIGVITGAPC